MVSRARASWAAAVAAAVLCHVGFADYVNPPGWEQEADFTHQTWEFNTGDSPLVADGTVDNSFGTPTMVDVFRASPDYMFWVQNMMFGGTRHGMWGGMTFSLPPTQTALGETFLVPGVARPAPARAQFWLQAAYWGSVDLAGQVLTVDIAADAGFQSVYLSYAATADDIEDQSATGGGSTGQYWRFTRVFTLPQQPGDVYVRVSLVPGGSMAVFIDQVSIDTRGFVPPPVDYNCSGRVNADDFAQLPDCWAGPEGGAATGNCRTFDFDADTDVDLKDFAAFQPVCEAAR